jgi:hypothetical protein
VNHYDITPLRVLAVLGIYALLFVVIWLIRPRIERDEIPTALAIGGVWAVSVFIANYLLYRAGAMSYLPWVNNFLHTFIWIGICLTLLYLGVRETTPMWQQFLMFFAFSMVVKYAEQWLFGTWDHDNFFELFDGNTAYVLGWSLADGTYPILTLFGLRLGARWIPGLVLPTPKPLIGR